MRGEGIDRELVDGLKLAESEFVSRIHEKIENLKGGAQWQAHAWLLERRRPADYGKQDRLDINARTANASAGDLAEMTPAERARFFREAAEEQE
jgi:hypothetical protein